MKFELGPFPIPKQHGAWSMLLIPTIMAMTLSDQWMWSSLFLMVAFVLIFLSHQPASRFLRRWKYRKIVDQSSLNWALLLNGSGVILAGGVFALHSQWIAMLFGAIVGIAFCVHLWLTLNKEHMSIPGEIIGVLGLTASAPTVYLFLHGSLDARGWVLWMINFLYFTGSIFYVKLKLRIQTSMPEPKLSEKIKTGLPLLTYGLLVLVYVLVISLIRGYSWFFFWAFVPFFFKALVGLFRWQDKQSLKVTRFGFFEVFHAIIFAVLSTVGFFHTLR